MPRQRVEGLIKLIAAVSGGALAVSAYLFLGADALELGEDLVTALQAAWALLFYSLAATVLVQLVEASAVAPRASRFFRLSAVAALLAGLALLAGVFLLALAAANAPEPAEGQAVRAVFGNITKCCRCASASWKPPCRSSRRAAPTS